MVTCEIKLFEIISKLFQCIISHVTTTTDSGHMWIECKTT